MDLILCFSYLVESGFREYPDIGQLAITSASSAFTPATGHQHQGTALGESTSHCLNYQQQIRKSRHLKRGDYLAELQLLDSAPFYCHKPASNTGATRPRTAVMGVIRKKTATRGGEGGVKYVCDVCSADITSTVS